MNLCASTLAAPPAAKRWGAVYDCGKHGHLTAAQIAKLAGVTGTTVRYRIAQGWRGDKLCTPYRSATRRKSDAPCRMPTVAIAVKLARAFPNKVPTTREIIAAHPMSRTAASRWRQAFRDVDERT